MADGLHMICDISSLQRQQHSHNFVATATAAATTLILEQALPQSLLTLALVVIVPLVVVLQCKGSAVLCVALGVLVVWKISHVICHCFNTIILIGYSC
eukprot:scaffold2190_cov187-Amphora_coffeaeformis.AAC.2